MPGIFLGTENAMIYAMTQFLLAIPVLFLNFKYYRMEFKTLFHGSPDLKMSPTMAAVIWASALYSLRVVHCVCAFSNRSTEPYSRHQ